MGARLGRVTVVLGITAAAVVGVALPATASTPAVPVPLPGTGVVTGTLSSQFLGTYAYATTYDLSFVGDTPVGNATYIGAFSLSGIADWADHTFCAEPLCLEGGEVDLLSQAHPLSGSLVLSGSSQTGDSISGVCGNQGSSFTREIQLSDEAVVQTVLVCTASLDGGPSVPLTLTTTTAGGPPTGGTVPIAGVFTSA